MAEAHAASATPLHDGFRKRSLTEGAARMPPLTGRQALRNARSVELVSRPGRLDARPAPALHEARRRASAFHVAVVCLALLPLVRRRIYQTFLTNAALFVSPSRNNNRFRFRVRVHF